MYVTQTNHLPHTCKIDWSLNIDKDITGVIKDTEEPEKVGDTETGANLKTPADKDIINLGDHEEDVQVITVEKINQKDPDGDFPMHDKSPHNEDVDKTQSPHPSPPGFVSSATNTFTVKDTVTNTSPNASATNALSVIQPSGSVSARISSPTIDSDALPPLDENLPTYLTQAVVSLLRRVSSAAAWQTLVNAFFEFEKASPPAGVCILFSFRSLYTTGTNYLSIL